MNKQGKIWGFTSEIFNKNNVEIHRLEGNANSYCSKHMHKHKYNMFFVERGIIIIKRWKNDYDLVDTTVLNKGQSCVVPPGEYHQFFVQNSCVVYEFYWVKISSKDIVRESTGGGMSKKVVLVQTPAFLFEVVPMFYKEAKKLGFFDKFYVVTDYKEDVNFGEDFQIIRLDKDLQFTSNILYALEYIEEDIITLCCEDNIFTAKNNVDKWNYNFDYFKTHPEMGFLRLSNTKKKVLAAKGYENKEIFPISTKYRYYISLQVAFWRKEYLKLALSPGLDAFDFERNGARKTRRAVRDGETAIRSYSVKNCVACRTNFYKDGKYYRRQFVDYALDNNMKFNMNKMIKSKQGIISCQDYVERFRK